MEQFVTNPYHIHTNLIILLLYDAFKQIMGLLVMRAN